MRVSTAIPTRRLDFIMGCVGLSSFSSILGSELFSEFDRILLTGHGFCPYAGKRMINYDNNITVDAPTGDESLEQVAAMLGVDPAEYVLGNGRVDDAKYRKVVIKVPAAIVAMASIASGCSALFNRVVRKFKAAVDAIKDYARPRMSIGEIALMEAGRGKTAGSCCGKYGHLVFEPAHNGRWVIASKPSYRYDGKVSVDVTDARLRAVQAACDEITKVID